MCDIGQMFTPPKPENTPVSVAPPPPTPVPSAQPAPVPTDVNPQLTAEQRRNRISALKFGAASTIRTSPQGITGAGPDLQTPSATGGKKTIGS